MFEIAGDAYDRYMGRYSRLLAPRLIACARIEPGMRALGEGMVAAADPSQALLAACAERVPGADLRAAPAEQLPWPDGTFDAVLSQLVVNFLADAPAGVGEMLRVVRPDGVVAACTWDYAHSDAPDEGRVMRYCSRDDLAALWRSSGLNDVETAPLEIEAHYADFDDYWTPFTRGVAPGGAYCASLEPGQREALREGVYRRLGSPEGAFTLPARAFAVRGRRPA